MNTRLPILLCALLAVASTAACGDGAESGGDAATAAPAGDTAIRSIERQPLGEADLAGLDRAQIGLELPWTGNRVARDAGSSPRATVESISTESHDAFDRVAVSFEGSTALPGYSVEFMDSGAELPCGQGPQSATLASDRLLVVRTGPSRAAREDGSRTMRTGTSRLGHPRLAEGGLVCDEADSTLWVAGLAEGSEIRVFEMRDPLRLVVDVR